MRFVIRNPSDLGECEDVVMVNLINLNFSFSAAAEILRMKNSCISDEESLFPLILTISFPPAPRKLVSQKEVTQN